MANPKHLKILKQGVKVWNKWREENPDIIPDLSKAKFREVDLHRVNFDNAKLHKAKLNGANLRKARLCKANLYKARLSRANLYKVKLGEANLYKAKLKKANLRKAGLCKADLKKVRLNGASLMKTDLSETKFRKANLKNANLSYANLEKASLRGADFRYADLSGANLNGANLKNALLVETILNAANLTGCRVYGISAWGLKLDRTIQTDLIITPRDEPVITVDNLEVAQFVYLILNRKKLRNIIDNITSKSVLILGRFTAERKAVLDAMANELRHHNLLPIIFDFERASSRDFSETIKTLAGMSLFVIADITNPRSAPLELQATVPDYQIPFVPVIQKGEKPFSMLEDLVKYPWVLSLLEYRSSDDLIKTFKGAIIDGAIGLHKELLVQKAEKMRIRSTEDYLKEAE